MNVADEDLLKEPSLQQLAETTRDKRASHISGTIVPADDGGLTVG